MKLLGAGLVAAASYLAGCMGRRSLARRVRVRRQLRAAVELLQGEMELNLPPVHELLPAVGGQLGGELGELLEAAGAEMRAVGGRPPQTALRIAAEQFPGLLDREEEQALLQLFGALGRFDLDGQLRAMEVSRRHLEELLAEAEENLRQKARTSMAASVCGGLALIVMLL